jgi:hypothetical protein
MSKIRFSSKSRDLREFAQRLGYTVTLTHGGHLKFLHPLGKAPVFSSATPTCPRAHTNAKKLLERNLRKDDQYVSSADRLIENEKRA